SRLRCLARDWLANPQPADPAAAEPLAENDNAPAAVEEPAPDLRRTTSDYLARGWSPQQAEPLLLAGARPWDAAEEEAARRAVGSAFSPPGEPGRDCPGGPAAADNRAAMNGPNPKRPRERRECRVLTVRAARPDPGVRRVRRPRPGRRRHRPALARGR